MRLLICGLALLAGRADADKAPSRESAISVVGKLESKSLREASGLARSRRDNGVLWAINDDGPARLYAIDETGRNLGKVDIEKARNRDWEDIASFTLDGEPYLLVADIGDNQASRNDVKVYVVEEPGADDENVRVAWEIEFSYPGGPRDAEALVVDAGNERILILSKRDIPAVLYALPLVPDGGKKIIATRIAELDGLPQPSARDVNNALALDDWHWQPTGMDISDDALLILTYRGVYYFRRNSNEPLSDTIKRPPVGLRIDKYPGAEAIAFGHDADTAFVTIEKKHAPLLRINLSGASRP